MDTTAALLRPVGAQHVAYDEPVCDPKSVCMFQGVLMGAALGALLWMPILWLIL